jgi:hypothetical protein
MCVLKENCPKPSKIVDLFGRFFGTSLPCLTSIPKMGNEDQKRAVLSIKRGKTRLGEGWLVGRQLESQRIEV